MDSLFEFKGDLLPAEVCFDLYLLKMVKISLFADHN